MGKESGNGLFDFEKLDVYQLALEFLDHILIVRQKLPRELRYSVGEQLVRAGLSISNNIAEGSGKWSKREKARYYGTAIDSARECISMFIVLSRQQCIAAEEYGQLRGRGRRITAMLHSLIGSLGQPLVLRILHPSQYTGTPVHSYTRTTSPRQSTGPLASTPS